MPAGCTGTSNATCPQAELSDCSKVTLLPNLSKFVRLSKTLCSHAKDPGPGSFVFAGLASGPQAGAFGDAFGDGPEEAVHGFRLKNVMWVGAWFERVDDLDAAFFGKASRHERHNSDHSTP